MIKVIYTGSIPQCPYCNKPTKRTGGGGMVTAMYFQPIYDENGKNTNPDKNTHTSHWQCLECNGQYTVIGNSINQVCLGTPDDIEKIIDAGYGDQIKGTDWAAGIIMGVNTEIIEMYQAEYDTAKGSCTFFNNGLCMLHDKGLKPTEGKLSHHSIVATVVNKTKSITWNVAKEWINPENAETIQRIEEKLNQLQNKQIANATI